MKKKKEIIEFLEGHASHDGYLAWNVKARTPNLDFEHLLETYRNSGHYASDEKYLDDPEWRREARELHDAEQLCNIAIEEAQAYIAGEIWWELPSGRQVEANFEFTGRSNDWIVLTYFEGVDCHRPSWREWGFPTLRKLANLVEHLDGEFTQSKAEAEIERRAAYFFVDEICAGLSRPI